MKEQQETVSMRKFSILIPTRERADTLKACLKTVTAQSYPDLEIVVSDNCSTDDTAEVVHAANDARVKYVNPRRRLSMSENWEFGLSHVTGDWLTIVGDDDGLLPGCFERMNDIIDSTGTDAVRTTCVSYTWPALTGKQWGRSSIPLEKGIVTRDSKEWLARVEAGDALYVELPMLYNGGFVKTQVLRRLMDSEGKFYRSCIPDVYSGVALARALPQYVYSHEPVAINGASKHSTGTSVFKVKEAGAPGTPSGVFSREGNIPFHADLPLMKDGTYPPSLQALVFESHLRSLEIMPGSDLPGRNVQLETVLATAPDPWRSSLHDDWGREYARLHGLDFNAVLRDASRRARSLKFRRAQRRVQRFLKFYEIGSAKTPIENVYDASRAAAAIRETPPPLSRVLKHRLQFAIERKLGR